MNNKTFKKILSCILSFAMLLMVFMPAIKIAKAASATVQFQGCGTNFDEPCFWIPPNGMVLPASSQPAPLFSFQLKNTGSTTLASVSINLVDGSSAGSVTANDIASLAVYKRTDWSSGMYEFPASDKIGELTSVNAFSSKVSNSNIISITQDGSKNSIPDDFWSAEYIVAIQTSANWSDTDQIRYSLSADWITVSDGTLGSAYTYPSENKDWYYATAPEGFMGDFFGVENVDYISDTEVDIRFTTEVEPTSAETLGNYAISGTNPVSVDLLDPHMVRLTFSGLTIVPNQTQVSIYGPSGVNGGVKDMMGETIDNDIVMMVMGGGGPGGGAPLLISEVMIGQGGDGLKEFIELYNVSPDTLDLSLMNVKLWAAYLNGTTLTHIKIADLAGTIPGYGYYLIASTDFGSTPAPDQTYTASNFDATEGALRPDSGIYINTSDIQNMAVIDRLGWGNAQGEMSEGPAKCNSSDPDACSVANDGKSLERKANPSSTATSMASGGADETNGNSYLSFNNQFDFIQRSTPDPQNSSFAPETPGGAGFGSNNNPPNIFHEPLFMVPTGNDLVIMAEIVDDSGQISASNTKLYYRFNNIDGMGTPESSWNGVNGIQTSSGSSFFKFTIPSITLDADKDIDYFLQANDGALYTCMPGPCGGDNLISSSVAPFYIDVQAISGNRVISGYVQDTSGNGISEVTVYLEGMPYSAITNTSGAFTISGLPDGIYTIRANSGSYTVNGVTSSYTDGWLDGISVNANNPVSSGNIIVLLQGSSGMGGDKENPWVMWSAPHDMMVGFPIDEPIIVVFDKEMNASTITGGSSTSDNIYLLDENGTVVPGTVVYYPDNSGRPSSLPPDPYLMTYTPTSNLNKETTYTLILEDLITDSKGNRLMGNRPSGGHSITFTTFFDTTGGTFGSGANFPPYVEAVTPGGGAFDVPVNTKVNITFNEAMEESSINTTNIKMYSVSNPFTANETETLFTNYAVSLDASGKIATLIPAANLSTSTFYRIKILGGCTSAKSIPMSETSTAEVFVTGFETSSSSAGDSAAPTIAGTFPNDGDAGIPSNIPSIDIGFSESMDPASINSNTVKLKRGSNPVAAIVEYDIGERAAHIMPATVLKPGASYTIFVASGSEGVKDVAGNVLSSDYTASFTTDSTVDSISPQLEFARCDDFACAITFSEPMNNAKIGEDDYTSGYSVLKKSNYTIKGGPIGTTDWNSGSGVHSADLTTTTIEYDQVNNTIIIMGINGLVSGEDFYIAVSNVKDKAGNSIDTNNNTFVGPVDSSANTGGMMGPGGPGPMMGPPDMGGGGIGGAGGFDFGGHWEQPTDVMPMNMMAGAITKYFVSMPITKAIPAGGKIILTFPSGFDVSNAAAVETNYSMANKDLNGPAPGTTTIASVVGSAASRTITITTAGDSLSANDFLVFDLKGIKNSTVPKGFDTNGYTVDIKTQDDNGKLLESMTSFPFFINEAGDYTLSGTITAVGANSGTAKVFLDSWITGPMETEVTFSSGTASYSFTGLNEGDYNLHTEPSITLGGNEYVGYMRPDPIFIDSSNCTNNVCTKNFSLTKADTGAALAVYITGDFSSMSLTDREIDIFAGGPEGGTVKTVTLGAQNYTSSSPYNTTLYLPSLDSDTSDVDEWWVGMGPAIPKGSLMMGPPPMPSWMPPSHWEVRVTGDPASPTWTERSTGGITTPTNATDDGIIVFEVQSASNEIIGYVVDSSGNGIANVDVDAHKTRGDFGMPSFAVTDNSGKFILKVTTGIYEVNAWMPGMPPSSGKVVEVKADTDNGATDGNATADVYKDNGTTLVVDLTTGYNASSPEEELLLKLNKSSTTISGKLLDENGDPVGYAPVWAYNQVTGEHMPSGTDASGNYTIYVNDGNWYVEAFIPGLGDVSYQNNPVSISGSSLSDINIRPSVTNLAIVSGTVTIGGSAVDNASVWIDGTDPDGSFYHNNTNTNSSGEYKLRVPGGTGYVLKAWTPEYGELDPVNIGTIAAGASITQDFTIDAGDIATLTINFTNYNALSSNTEAFVDIFDPTSGKGNHERLDDLSTTSSITMSIKKGTNYEIHMYIPGIGGIDADCVNGTNIVCTDNTNMPDTWAISGDAAVTFTIPDVSSLYTFSVTVTDGTNALEDAFVWMGNESSGFHAGEPTNSSGLASLKVPAGTYKMGGDKPGYTGPAPIAIVAGGANDNLSTACTTYDSDNKICTLSITMSSNPYTLSGRIYKDSNSNGSYDSGEEVSNAWVWADKVTSTTDFTFAGGWTGTETDPDGNYQLSISDGYWLIRAVADGYKETVYTVGGEKTAVQINGASVTGKDIALRPLSSYTAIEPKSAPVTPATGGTVDDSVNTGVKLTIPPSVLGTDTSAGTVNIKETSAVPKTDSMAPLAGKGKNITATNSSGQAITSLSGSMNIEISYDELDLPTGVDESQLMLVYFDETKGEWVEVSAVQDTTNNKFSGNTTHLTTYAIAYNADTDGPTTPSNLTQNSVSSNSVSFSWTASTDSETAVDGYEITRSTDGVNFATIGNTDPWANGSYNNSVLVTTTSYTDSTVSSGTTYYYQVIAYDTAGNHSASSSSLQVTTSSAPPSGGGGYTAPQQQTETDTEDTLEQTEETSGEEQVTEETTGEEQSSEEGIQQETTGGETTTPVSQEFSTSPSNYAFEYVSQSSYPRVAPGMTTTLKLTLKNTGTATWYKTGSNPMRLGTSHPKDRLSILLGSANRVSLDQISVASGEEGTFTFIITAPETEGTYREYFQPVVDGITWLTDIGIYWDIIVEKESYHAQYIGQSPYITVSSDGTATLWVEYKNTGTATWYKGGENPIHLGTSEPQDRSSIFQHSSWLSSNRPAEMNKDEVLPGEIARFIFTIDAGARLIAPLQPGVYKEYFRPVVEGVQWLEDVGLYWEITVE